MQGTSPSQRIIAVMEKGSRRNSAKCQGGWEHMNTVKIACRNIFNCSSIHIEMYKTLLRNNRTCNKEQPES